MIALHPPSHLPPPDPNAAGRHRPRFWYRRPELLTRTPWWARPALPGRIAVLVPAPRSSHPALSAAAVTALLCVAWGGLIGCAAGATAGTMIVPVFGTAYGGLIGTAIGALVGVAWAPLTVGVLTARHRRVVGTHEALPDIARLLGVLVVLLGVIGAAIVGAALFSDAPAASIWALAIVTATIAVVMRLLRAAAASISLAWCSPFGWQRA